MHPRLSLYNPPYRKMTSWREMVDLASSLGVSFLECFSLFEFKDPDVDAARALREYADARGVRISCLSVYADLVGEACQTHVCRLKEYAKVASVLGSPFLHHTVAPHFSLTDKGEGELSRAFEAGISAVRRVFDASEEYGVRTVFENQAFLFNGVERYGAFLQCVERNVGIVADFGNIFQADECIEAFLERFAKRVVHVHLKDMKTVAAPTGSLLSLKGAFVQECDIGDGEVDFSRALSLLKAAGYRGVFSVERHAYETDVDVPKVFSAANSLLSEF